MNSQMNNQNVSQNTEMLKDRMSQNKIRKDDKENKQPKKKKVKVDI